MKCKGNISASVENCVFWNVFLGILHLAIQCVPICNYVPSIISYFSHFVSFSCVCLWKLSFTQNRNIVQFCIQFNCISKCTKEIYILQTISTVWNVCCVISKLLLCKMDTKQKKIYREQFPQSEKITKKRPLFFFFLFFKAKKKNNAYAIAKDREKASKFAWIANTSKKVKKAKKNTKRCKQTLKLLNATSFASDHKRFFLETATEKIFKDNGSWTWAGTAEFAHVINVYLQFNLIISESTANKYKKKHSYTQRRNISTTLKTECIRELVATYRNGERQ